MEGRIGHVDIVLKLTYRGNVRGQVCVGVDNHIGILFADDSGNFVEKTEINRGKVDFRSVKTEK